MAGFAAGQPADRDAAGGYAASVVELCRALRARGLAVTPAEAVDAVRALAVLDLGDARELRLALRSVLVSRREDYAIFDEVFGAWWTAAVGERPLGPERKQENEDSGPAPSPRSATGAASLSLDRWLRPEAAADAEPAGVPALSAREVLVEKDVSGFGDAELRAMARLAARISRRLAMRRSRRWKPAHRGGRIGMRRTVRQSLRTGGEPVELAFRERKRRKARLVVLCDVSGSMDLYARLLLQFVYALQNCFARVETFLFSTRLSRVTDELRGEPYRAALDRLAAGVHDWSGGTRIGESVAAFNAGWGADVDRRTIVVILSDGWDTGEPERLAAELRWLRRRAGKLIWLNPLLGSPTYRPLTRGMQAALPHVDVFAPAHDLASLGALVRHLVV